MKLGCAAPTLRHSTVWRFGGWACPTRPVPREPPNRSRTRTPEWLLSATRISALLMASVLVPVDAIAEPCTGKGVELQVLGSGGPELEDKRASSSYLLWQDGRPRILVDSGGGSALRFGQSGAQVAQLDAILFSHLHIDDSGDFAALIKSSYFEERDRELPVYGPLGNADFPRPRSL